MRIIAAPAFYASTYVSCASCNTQLEQTRLGSPMHWDTVLDHVYTSLLETNNTTITGRPHPREHASAKPRTLVPVCRNMLPIPLLLVLADM